MQRATKNRLVWCVTVTAACIFAGAVVHADDADEAACRDHAQDDPCLLAGGGKGVCQLDDVNEDGLECDAASER